MCFVILIEFKSAFENFEKQNKILDSHLEYVDMSVFYSV